MHKTTNTRTTDAFVNPAFTLGTDAGAKAPEPLTVSTLAQAGLERVTQNVKRYRHVLILLVEAGGAVAIDSMSLFLVQFQPILTQPLFKTI